MKKFLILNDGKPCVTVKIDKKHKEVVVDNVGVNNNEVDFLINKLSSYEDVVKFISSRVNLCNPSVKRSLKALGINLDIYDAIKLTNGLKFTDSIEIKTIE